MKVLIWIIAFAIPEIIKGVIRSKYGIILGAIPVFLLYSLFLPMAPIFCKLWDKKRNEKKTGIKDGIDYNIVEGKKPYGNRPRIEYLESVAPNYIIKICKEPQRRSDLAARLQPYISSGQLDKRMAKALIEEFSINQ